MRLHQGQAIMGREICGLKPADTSSSVSVSSVMGVTLSALPSARGDISCTRWWLSPQRKI